MSDKPKNSNGDAGVEAFSETDIAKARNWFGKAQELAEKKSYDYAIECYINGLEFWPEAVDEGHKPCRAAALFRGGKKVSFTDGIKYKTSHKDPKKAMLNSEMLLAKSPKNISYMEALFKSAARGKYAATFMWIGGILADAAAREEKPNPARFVLMRETYEELADRMIEIDPRMSINALDRAIEALSRLRTLKPEDMGISNELRDVAGKLTIIKGKYSSAESFVDSMEDLEGQRELHDKDRVVQAADRIEQLAAKARKLYEADPTNPAAINELVDLLCRTEDNKQETQAIGLLVKAFKDTQEYRYKMRADDIRIKQLNRQARQILESGDRQAAREHYKNQLRFELAVFRDRVRQYPTDMRMRYDYGMRMFKARRHDQAIPILQEARSDPKTRFQCCLYIGRCFFEKKYYSEAIDTFKEAIETYEMPDDDLGKKLHYWLGRSYEADKRVEEALKIYGQLIQWDYNYRDGDVRKRIDTLKVQG